MTDKTFSLVFSETESDPLITRVTVVFETPAISAIDFLLTFFPITPFFRTLSAFIIAAYGKIIPKTDVPAYRFTILPAENARSHFTLYPGTQ